VRSGFEKVLDSHGYGFQYAVQEQLNSFASVGPASWQFEASEFPVRVGTRETRIDFVYRNPNGLGYLVGECKRVNRGMDWGFVRAGSTRQRHGEHELRVEALDLTPRGQVRAVTTTFRQHPRYADIGRELRTDKDGEGGLGSGRSGIEDAVTQVLIGTSGLSKALSESPNRIPVARPVSIVPVVFTTARLWYSEATLASAELPMGDLSLEGRPFEEVPWLPLQYHQSNSLVSEVHREAVIDTLADRLYQLHRRTVFIVNVGGIRQFIEWTLTAHG
jgi:hypothetical protein